MARKPSAFHLAVHTLNGSPLPAEAITRLDKLVEDAQAIVKDHDRLILNTSKES